MSTIRTADSLAAHAADLHRRAVVIDGQAVKSLDPPSPAGGVTAEVVTLAYKLHEDFGFAMRQIAGQLEFLDFYADRLLLVRTVDDIQRAKHEGKRGIIFCFQSTTPIGNEPFLTRVFHEVGVRIIQLTYNERIPAGCGCMEPNDTGLTDYGRQLIRTMERVGVLLDLSHVGRRTSLDALAYSEKPAVFSHSNPAALYEVPRNVTNEQIRAVAETGGLVGITPVSLFFAKPEDPQPTISHVIDHVAYVADLVGIDHVALATDAQVGVTSFAFATGGVRTHGEWLGPRPLERMACSGFETRAEFPNATLEMGRRGFSDEDITKVLGNNWIRVFRAAWTPRPFRV